MAYSEENLFSWSLLQDAPVMLELVDYGVHVVSWGNVCMGVKMARLLAYNKSIGIPVTPYMRWLAASETMRLVRAGAIPDVVTSDRNLEVIYTHFSSRVTTHIYRKKFKFTDKTKLASWFDARNSYKIYGTFEPQEVVDSTVGQEELAIEFA